MATAVTFDAASHRYTIDGRELAAVTKIIGRVIRKPGLERWIGNVGNLEAERRKEEAGERGTLVHALASLHAEGTPDIPLGGESAIRPQLRLFEQWYADNVQDMLACELIVHHPRYDYVGTLDFLVRLRGDRIPTVIDVKSGAAMWPEMRYQTAAYREAVLLGMLYEQGIKDCRRAIVQVAEGAVIARFHEHTEHALDFEGFLACLYLYHDLRRGI
jgi:hypothetical protein